jgi:hypothetical protein
MTGMSVEQMQRILDRYFGLMGRDEDFAECLTTDVTWLVADTAEVIEGPGAVRDYVIALHERIADFRSRTPVVGDGFVYLEGDCAAASSPDSRVNYCIAYDMRDDLIAAMRCYGLGAV